MIKIEPIVARRYRPIFTMLYTETDYGSGDLCTGIKYYECYKKWLKPKIIDLGCGVGDAVDLFREEGLEADGIDWMMLGTHMKLGDITKPLDFTGYTTATCLDVLQHVADRDLDGLFRNMQQTERQVFIFHTGSSVITLGHRQVEMHQNQKSKQDWCDLISNYFEIVGSCLLDRRSTTSPTDLRRFLVWTNYLSP